MRRQWLVALLPVLCLLVPAIAHADTIDDFHLTGGGYTITFSLPANPKTFVSTGAGGSIVGFDVNAEVDANGTEFNATNRPSGMGNGLNSSRVAPVFAVPRQFDRKGFDEEKIIGL